MQEVFEKIIEKLEERTLFLSDCTKYGNKDTEQQNKSYSTMMMYEVADLAEDLIDIVKQAAAEYNNGWIPCSERLPEDCVDVLVWFEYFRYGDYNRLFKKIGISYTYNGEWSGFVNGGSGWRQLKIIAWQPLPEPYEQKGE